MTYPAISISISDERSAKLTKILRALRDQDETVSRSEAVGRAIDHFFLIVCPADSPESPRTDHVYEKTAA